MLKYNSLNTSPISDSFGAFMFIVHTIQSGCFLILHLLLCVSELRLVVSRESVGKAQVACAPSSGYHETFYQGVSVGILEKCVDLILGPR